MYSYKTTIATFLISVFPITALAEWNYVNTLDAFTDEKVVGVVYSDNEHRIQLSREYSDVWMYINRNEIGSFEPDTIIELRVDENETKTIDPSFLKQLGDILEKPTYIWEPATVGFLIWHGEEDSGCGYIEQLLNGKELQGRYYLNRVLRDTFSISLEGAKEAIIEGLELSICGH